MPAFLSQQAGKVFWVSERPKPPIRPTRDNLNRRNVFVIVDHKTTCHLLKFPCFVGVCLSGGRLKRPQAAGSSFANMAHEQKEKLTPISELFAAPFLFGVAFGFGPNSRPGFARGPAVWPVDAILTTGVSIARLFSLSVYSV